MTDAAARDPGLQPERTALSWNRTALTVTVNALLSFRSGISSGQPAFIVVGAVLTAAAVAAIVFGVHRRHQLGRAADAPVEHAAVVVTTAVTLLACAAGVASILWAG